MTQANPARAIARSILLIFWITSGFGLLAWLSGNTTVLLLVCAGGTIFALIALLWGAYVVARINKSGGVGGDG